MAPLLLSTLHLRAQLVSTDQLRDWHWASSQNLSLESPKLGPLAYDHSPFTTNLRPLWLMDQENSAASYLDLLTVH